MISAALRRRVDQLLSEVTLPVPFDLAEFCAALARRRARPIYLRAVDTAAVGLPSGATFATEDADVVLYDATTTRYHQTVIVLHEAGHLVAGHYADHLLSEDAAAYLLPEIGERQVRRLAAREEYTSDEEREAEFFARRVLELIGRQSAETGPEAALLERVGSTFEQ